MRICTTDLLCIQAALLHPDVAPGASTLPSGCYAKSGIDSGQLFGWEFIMTFVLVMTVYAVAGQQLVLMYIYIQAKALPTSGLLSAFKEIRLLRMQHRLREVL